MHVIIALQLNTSLTFSQVDRSGARFASKCPDKVEIYRTRREGRHFGFCDINNL